MWITLAKYLGPAALAAFAAWWITSSVDDAQYKALQVLQADAIIASQQKDLDALNAYHTAVDSALRLADAAVATSKASQNKLATALHDKLAEVTDASLNACLDSKLPDGILRTLAH